MVANIIQFVPGTLRTLSNIGQVLMESVGKNLNEAIRIVCVVINFYFALEDDDRRRKY